MNEQKQSESAEAQGADEHGTEARLDGAQQPLATDTTAPAPGTALSTEPQAAQEAPKAPAADQEATGRVKAVYLGPSGRFTATIGKAEVSWAAGEEQEVDGQELAALQARFPDHGWSVTGKVRAKAAAKRKRSRGKSAGERRAPAKAPAKTPAKK